MKDPGMNRQDKAAVMFLAVFGLVIALLLTAFGTKSEGSLLFPALALTNLAIAIVMLVSLKKGHENGSSKRKLADNRKGDRFTAVKRNH